MNNTTSEAPELPNIGDSFFIKCSLNILFVLNALLLIFLFYKLCKLQFQAFESFMEKKNISYRFKTFLLIFVAIIIKEIAIVLHLLPLFSSEKPAYFNSILLISDTLPSLLFITIATTSTYYWHEIYSSYDEMFGITQKIERKNWFKLFVILFNIILYIAFTILIMLYIFQNAIDAPQILSIILIPSLFLSLILLVFHGRILHDKTIVFVNYTGRRIGAGGFKVIYRILLLCCLLKGIHEVLMLSLSGQDDTSLSPPLFIVYFIVFDLFGEFGVFFALVILFERNAKRYEIERASLETGLIVDDGEEEKNASSLSFDSKNEEFDLDYYQIENYLIQAK